MDEIFTAAARGELSDLRDAVRDYLDALVDAEAFGYRAPWPGELEKLTGWTPPEGMDI